MSTRFARVVGVVAYVAFDNSVVVLKDDAVKLLQREHAAVARKVKDDKKKAERVQALSRKSYQEGVWLADGQRQYCAELLTWLDGRGR